jgi:CHAT domain-containing protein
MTEGFIHRGTMALCAAALVCVALPPPVLAATHEEIVQTCRQALRPQIHACVVGKLGGPVKRAAQADLAKARQQCGPPLVRPCVMREEQKEAARKPPPAAPQDKTAVAGQGGAPVKPAFVPPPRTIDDITAILAAEKPDDAAIAARKAAADATPPSHTSAAKLAQFYYDRGNARELLARNKEALADGLQALAVGGGAIEFRQTVRLRQFVSLQYTALGDLKQAMATAELAVRSASSDHRGAMINALDRMTRLSILLGDVGQADAYARRVEALVQEARGSPSPKWRAAYSISGDSWEADDNTVRAVVFEARGQYPEAEAAFRRAEAFRRASLKNLPRFQYPPPPDQVIQAADEVLLAAARNEAKQGRLSEAEADARRALLEILKARGEFSPAAPEFIVGLSGILVDEGRYQDAETLARAALAVQQKIGVGDDAPESASILSQLGNILILERKAKEAGTVYAELDKAIAQWPPQQREAFELNGSRIVALYAAGQIQQGIAAAEQLVKRETSRTGANSYDTAMARGTLAVGYARGGRDADATREFKAAIPIMMSAARENAENDDPTVVAARRTRLQRIVEAYIDLLARSPTATSDVAAETFTLADAVRGHAVERSLAESSARLAIRDPALADLVRTDQDLGKQVGAELGTLNNLLALPPEQRDDQKVSAVRAEVEKLRAQRATAQQEIKRRFPSYADLVDPKPPSVDEIKATLRPDEALLSFYFGQTASFVWAVPKDGPVAFAKVPLTALELSAKVHTLREALDPQVARVEEIPPFDVSLAYELYGALLKPVEAAWKNAKSLIVVTNGALGELPLGLLPTAPSQVDLKATPLFAGYRAVPWLARSHAVTVIPSASALITLRHLAPGSPQRDKLIGFGDPYFNATEAAEAEQEASAAPAQMASASTTDAGPIAVTRGIPLKLRASPHTEGVDSAELAMLPRLPDTRAELIAMAHALDVDPANTLYLGKAANEQNVETLDLSHYRIVAFATHGLVPGDLDGLTQPALALTAPEVAGVPGDGLLTMGKIMALKLDADWVVLSACNTAAGAGAGAEAASGLGSAFFYAGTRALLVTNWPVHSLSARALITDLFRRQSADASLSRGEALREAMMALIDGPGYVDSSGHTLYTYAHPLFWAPYSVIGDGGGH